MLIEVKNVEKYYGQKDNITKALDNVSFSMEAGEFTSIMGASGSGKTTLLNCLSTIDKVSAGQILLEGQDITELKPNEIASFRSESLGFIFQDYNLLDTLTIEENIALPLTLRSAAAGEIRRQVYEIADILQITDILSKFPYQVSGGQKQRGACARAVITTPKIVLADEPTGALDSGSSSHMLKMMKRLNEDLQMTILMVTHDAVSASYSNRILFLKDGRIFNELVKGSKSRSKFYYEILDVLTLLGGDPEC